MGYWNNVQLSLEIRRRAVRSRRTLMSIGQKAELSFDTRSSLFAERFRGVPGHAFERGFDLRLVPEKLDHPLHWRRPRKIFVNSMSDLFHEDVPPEYIACVGSPFIGVHPGSRAGSDVAAWPYRSSPAVFL
jgi:hypothetical protein